MKTKEPADKGAVMKKVLLRIISFSIIISFIVFPITTTASGDISFSKESQSVSGQVMTLAKDTKAFKTPDENALVAQSFSKGETVYVVGESDGWYEIFYKGENLYIPGDSMNEDAVNEALEASKELAKEASEELKEAGKQDAVEIETYERQRQRDMNALIWKIVIASLVIIIIVFSVIIGIANAKDDKVET